MRWPFCLGFFQCSPEPVPSFPQTVRASPEAKSSDGVENTSRRIGLLPGKLKAAAGLSGSEALRPQTETRRWTRRGGEVQPRLVSEIEIANDLETTDLRSDERAEDGDAVQRHHGDGKDLNHGYIHLDKSIRETQNATRALFRAKPGEHREVAEL